MTWYRPVKDCIRMPLEEDIRVAKDVLEKLHPIDNHYIKISHLLIMDSADDQPIGITTLKLILQYFDRNPSLFSTGLIRHRPISEGLGQAYVPTEQIEKFLCSKPREEIQSELREFEIYNRFSDLSAILLHEADGKIVGFANQYDIFIKPYIDIDTDEGKKKAGR